MLNSRGACEANTTCICAHKDTRAGGSVGTMWIQFFSSGFVAGANYCTVVACITTPMSLKPLVDITTYLLMVGYRLTGMRLPPPSFLRKL